MGHFSLTPPRRCAGKYEEAIREKLKARLAAQRIWQFWHGLNGLRRSPVSVDARRAGLRCHEYAESDSEYSWIASGPKRAPRSGRLQPAAAHSRDHEDRGTVGERCR